MVSATWRLWLSRSWRETTMSWSALGREGWARARAASIKTTAAANAVAMSPCRFERVASLMKATNLTAASGLLTVRPRSRTTRVYDERLVLVSLKVDVDTFLGMREGLHRLLEMFRERRILASVFVSMGPDHSGRAIRRVL